VRRYSRSCREKADWRNVVIGAELLAILNWSGRECLPERIFAVGKSCRIMFMRRDTARKSPVCRSTRSQAGASQPRRERREPRAGALETGPEHVSRSRHKTVLPALATGRRRECAAVVISGSRGAQRQCRATLNEFRPSGCGWCGTAPRRRTARSCERPAWLRRQAFQQASRGRGAGGRSARRGAPRARPGRRTR